jgi:cytochrome c553
MDGKSGRDPGVRWRMTPLRWIGSLAAFATLSLLVLLAAVWVRGGRILHRQYEVPPHPSLPVVPDSDAIARGEHIARSIGNCTLCHGEDLGGAVYMDEGPFGIAAGPNLTAGRGGVAPSRSDEDWVRAIRYGVRANGASLLLMPSEVFVHLSDRDLAALIAYVKQVPPVDRDIPASRLRWVGRLLTGAGRLNLLAASKTEPLISVPEVEAGVTPAYGRYLVETSGCAGCHGYGLSGGRVAGPPGLPLASNLTPAGAIAAWSETDFIRAMRDGMRPGGAPIDEFMPWRAFSRMTDDELRAILVYLRSVPAKQFGHK